MTPAHTRPALPRTSLASWGRVALPVLGAAGVLLVALASIDPSVLCVLPALALALLLALRRYPGETALMALAGRDRSELSRRATSALTRSRRWGGPMLPRGGLLLACSLATRPPPAALATR